MSGLSVGAEVLERGVDCVPGTALVCASNARCQ